MSNNPPSPPLDQFTPPVGVDPEMLADMLSYLDELRDCGEINMLGTGPYLQNDFDVDARTARAVLSFWTVTFGSRHPNE